MVSELGYVNEGSIKLPGGIVQAVVRTTFHGLWLLV